MSDSTASCIKKKKNVAFHMWSNRCLITNTDISPNSTNGRKKNVYIYVNTWKIRELLTFDLHDTVDSTLLEKDDVIFMIVKTSSLRNKSDEEAGVSLDQKLE